MKEKKKNRSSICTLGASLLGNLLTSKNTIRAGESTINAGHKF